MREMLINRVYVGEIVYGKSRVEVVDSKYVRTRLPEREWLRVEKPELRIIPDQLWRTVQAQQAQRKQSYLRSRNGQLQGPAGWRLAVPARGLRGLRSLRRQDGCVEHVQEARQLPLPDVLASQERWRRGLPQRA